MRRIQVFVSCFYKFKRAWLVVKNNLFYKPCLGRCGKNVELKLDRFPSSPSRIILDDNTNLYAGFRFISVTGRFIMKRNSGASIGLTVITGNHQRKKSVWFKSLSGGHSIDIEKDVVIEEDVWLGANVTILSGVTIGRGATVGAGSVCIKSIPPYAVVMGNPCKVVGFNFTPEEIINHEKTIYPESERLPIETIKKNYEKYFLNKLEEIKQYNSTLAFDSKA